MDQTRSKLQSIHDAFALNWIFVSPVDEQPEGSWTKGICVYKMGPRYIIFVSVVVVHFIHTGAALMISV